MIVTFLFIVSKFIQYFLCKEMRSIQKEKHKANKVLREFQGGKFHSSYFRILEGKKVRKYNR